LRALNLSVDGRIRIAELKQLLSLGRLAQVEPNSEAGQLRLDASGGDTASRCTWGAAAVDRVILSDTSQWDKYDHLRLR
jgi:HlyD family secretion protein